MQARAPAIPAASRTLILFFLYTPSSRSLNLFFLYTSASRFFICPILSCFDLIETLAIGLMFIYINFPLSLMEIIERMDVFDRLFNMKRAVTYLIISIFFGGFYFWFQEIIQFFIIPSGHYTERCSNLLFDRAQWVNSLCAGLACFFYIRKFIKMKGHVRIFLTPYFCSWKSFLGYFIFMALYVLFRSECSALYSPGPIRFMMPILAYMLGAIVLLFELSLWALPCAIFLAILVPLSISIMKTEDITEEIF
jgi:hypothetical protein